MFLAVGVRAGTPPALVALDKSAAQTAPAQLGAPLQGGGVVTGNTPRRMLHFTFDDGPSAEYTPLLLDALDRAGFKATFFFSTSRFTGVEHRNAHAVGMAREVARRGHQLGSHGFDHARMARLGPAQLQAQLEKSDAMFHRVFGARTFLFRPPFGSRNAALDKMLGDGGYVTTMWNIGMADWVEREPALIELTFWRALARNETRDGDRGGVVLLHDTHPWSVAAFDRIATSIAQRNCELLKAGEELYDVVDSLEPWVKPLSDDLYAARQAAVRKRAEVSCARADR